MRPVRLLQLLATALLALPLAQAATIYWYAGNDFQTVDNGGGAWATDSQSITAWFQVDSLLAPSSLFNLTPVDWSLSDGVHSLLAATPDLDTFALTIFTDSSGNFSFWSFLASAAGSGFSEPLRVTLSTSSGQDLSAGFFTSGVSTAMNQGLPGTWATTTVSTAPEPSSFAFAAVGGILMLATGVRRRRLSRYGRG